MRRLASSLLALSLAITVTHAAPDAGAPAGVTQVAEGHYRVSAALADALLGDLAVLAREVRVVPAFHGGRAEGFKVFGIRPGSTAMLLGLRSGDVITAVDGIPLTSPEYALQAYARARAVDRIVLAVKRRGAPMTLTWTFEGAERKAAGDVPIPPAPLQGQAVAVRFAGAEGQWSAGADALPRLTLTLRGAALDGLALPRRDAPALTLPAIELGTVTLTLAALTRAPRQVLLPGTLTAAGARAKLAVVGGPGLELRGGGGRSEARLRLAVDVDLTAVLGADAALSAQVAATPSPFLTDGVVRLECAADVEAVACTPVERKR